MRFLLLIIGAILSTAWASAADTIHVVVREYRLEHHGEAEPIWNPLGKPREWHEPSQGLSAQYGTPVFPDVEAPLVFNERLSFAATRTERGRINIDVNSGDTNLAHSQDDLFGDFYELVYCYRADEDGKDIYRIEIKVWTTPRDK